MSPQQIARFIVGLSWMYHGFFPKLFHIAPVEKAMTASIGLSEEVSYWVTKSAGVGEIIFGIMIIVFYTNRAIVLLNIVALVALLLFVAILAPSLLIGAFNPVTTNIALIGLSLILLSRESAEQRQ